MIRQALRLVELAFFIALIAITATAGYSGYQEYNALTSLSKTSNIHGSLNGTSYTISGIVVPNNMTYPLSLSILAQVSLEHSLVGNFTSGEQMIQPGQTKSLSISFGLNFTRAIESNTALLQELLFNQTTLFVNSTLLADIVPLLGLSLASSANETLEPALQDLNLQVVSSEVASNQSTLLVPIVVSWTNASPFSFNGTIDARLVQIPGNPPGVYGTVSGIADVTPLSSNSLELTFGIPISELRGSTTLPSGSYEFQFNLNAYGTSVQFNRNVTV